MSGYLNYASLLAGVYPPLSRYFCNATWEAMALLDYGREVLLSGIHKITSVWYNDRMLVYLAQCITSLDSNFRNDERGTGMTIEKRWGMKSTPCHYGKIHKPHAPIAPRPHIRLTHPPTPILPPTPQHVVRCNWIPASAGMTKEGHE